MLWRVNFRETEQSVTWARPHTLTPSQRVHVAGLEPVSRAAPELCLLQDGQGPSRDPCSQGQAAQASPRGTPLVSQDVLMYCEVMSHSLRPCGLHPPRLLCPWDSPGKNIEVGCHCLLQGVFPTRGSNPLLLHCRWGLYR